MYLYSTKSQIPVTPRTLQSVQYDVLRPRTPGSKGGQNFLTGKTWNKPQEGPQRRDPSDQEQYQQRLYNM